MNESSLLKMSFNIEYSCHTITNIKQGWRLFSIVTNWSLTLTTVILVYALTMLLCESYT